MTTPSPEKLAEEMQDPAFWRRLSPRLNTQGAAIGPPVEIPDLPLDITFQELCALGYTQFDGLLPVEEIDDVLVAVKAVREIGLLPVYAFAFDETWSIFLRLAPIWKRFLGTDWSFLPAFWVWWIDQDPRSSGWPAHRDRGQQNSVHPDGTPMSISAWVPLTRALPSNGCMYVLPEGLEFEALDRLNVQHARALPVGPGSLLIWKQNVWHWSGTSSRRAPNPRVSMSFELQTAAVPAFQAPLLDPLALPPTLNLRLALIGRQVLSYRHFTRLEGPSVELAEALVKLG